MMNVKEKYNLKCVDLNHDGLGVAKIDNFPIFVSNFLPDEEAEIEITKVNSNYATGKVINLTKKSSNRVNPLCPKFGVCGGCDLMHMNYNYQVEFKLKMVNETLKRIGHIDYNIKEIISADNTYNYRNKVQIPYQFNGKKNICGFYKKKSHDLVEVDDCLISPDKTIEIARFIRNIFNEFNIKAYDEVNDKGVLRNLLIRKNYLDEYMIVLISRVDKINDIDKIVNKIINRYSFVKSVILNYNPKENNTILGESFKVLYGNDYLVEDICGLKFRMSHKAFFQVNHEQTEKLYNKVIEFADVNESMKVLDLYCGVGTISLLFSKYVSKVTGVEVVEEAVKNANVNKELNKEIIKAKDVKFVLGKSEDVISDYINDCDLLVVDPPRKGLDQNVIKNIIENKVKKMIYVSCDCATLARDLSLLSEYYEIVNGCCVDLFPNTADVESVVKLRLKG